MRRAKLIAGIVLIFLLGGLAGASAMRFYGWRYFDRPHSRPNHAQRVEFIMERLKDDLGLTSGQMAGIKPIVEQGDKEIMALRRTIRPKMRKIHDQGFLDIRAKLRPEQQRKLDELVAKLKRFSKKPANK